VIGSGAAPVVLPSSSVGGFIERMWAYMTIQRMIDEASLTSTPADVAAANKAEALRLSLKVQSTPYPTTCPPILSIISSHQLRQ
jgi:hypothetical protein